MMISNTTWEDGVFVVTCWDDDEGDETIWSFEFHGDAVLASYPVLKFAEIMGIEYLDLLMKYALATRP